MESLGLDLKILIAQVVNFVILLFVLKKLLYKPVIKLIDERNKKINDAVVNSQRIEEKLAKIEEKQKTLISDARQKADVERSEILKLAETQREKIVADAKNKAQKEIEKGIEQLHAARIDAVNEISEEFMDKITKKLLTKLSTSAKSDTFPLLRKTLKR